MRYIKRQYKELLERFSLAPYKTVELRTGLIVDHYKNGSMIADRKRLSNGKIVRAK
jgi:hypothetical protein